jgi:plasmid stabilization system protein ParE
LEIELTSSRRSGPYRNQRFYRQRYRAAAERFVARLRQRIEVLRAFPEAGHRIRKNSYLRALVERPIIIVYALKAERIEVLRFWHGSARQAEN